MYKYTQEQLDSMKKVEATREARLKTLFGRMTADEKQTVLKENHPDYIESAYENLKVGPNKGGKVLHELAVLQLPLCLRRAVCPRTLRPVREGRRSLRAQVQEAALHHSHRHGRGCGQGGRYRPDRQELLAQRAADHRRPDRPVLQAGGGIVWM